MGTLWHAMRTGAFHHPAPTATWGHAPLATAKRDGLNWAGGCAVDAVDAAARHASGMFGDAVAAPFPPAPPPPSSEGVLRDQQQWDAWSVLETIKEVAAALQVCEQYEQCDRCEKQNLQSNQSARLGLGAVS